MGRPPILTGRMYNLGAIAGVTAAQKIRHKLAQCLQGRHLIAQSDHCLQQLEVTRPFNMLVCFCVYLKNGHCCFCFFKIVDKGCSDLMKLEHTLLQMAATPDVCQGVAYFLAVPLEDGTWFARYV